MAPENTVEAFRAAARAGADMIELDVRRTADGALVVHHDAALADNGVIVELRAADLPRWLPSLADALNACAGMTVNVEIKNSPRDPDFDATNDIAVRVADEIDRVGWRDRVIVSSFNLGAIDAIVDRVDTGWLTLPGTEMDDAIAVAADHGHNAIHPYDTSVTAEVVSAAHAAGLAINVWTVDDAARLRDLASWGVDGIVTNDVALARRLLRA